MNQRLKHFFPILSPLQNWAILLIILSVPTLLECTYDSVLPSPHYAPSDILLVDEVLTVGDQRFQRKCVKKIEEFLEQEKTIVLVSHDLHSIRSLCDRVLWLDKGRILELVRRKRSLIDMSISIVQQRRKNISGPFLGATHTPPQNFSDDYRFYIYRPRARRKF